MSHPTLASAALNLQQIYPNPDHRSVLFGAAMGAPRIIQLDEYAKSGKHPKNHYQLDIRPCRPSGDLYYAHLDIEKYLEANQTVQATSYAQSLHGATNERLAFEKDFTETINFLGFIIRHLADDGKYSPEPIALRRTPQEKFDPLPLLRASVEKLFIHINSIVKQLADLGDKSATHFQTMLRLATDLCEAHAPKFSAQLKTYLN